MLGLWNIKLALSLVRKSPNTLQNPYLAKKLLKSADGVTSQFACNFCNDWFLKRDRIGKQNLQSSAKMRITALNYRFEMLQFSTLDHNGGVSYFLIYFSSQIATGHCEHTFLQVSQNTVVKFIQDTSMT